MPRDPSLEYDTRCNHCGRSIHPPRPPATDDHEEIMRWLIEQGTREQDCVWLERHRMRYGRMSHPATNYICRACDLLLDTWLRQAWRSESQREGEGDTP